MGFINPQTWGFALDLTGIKPTQWKESCAKACSGLLYFRKCTIREVALSILGGIGCNMSISFAILTSSGSNLQPFIKNGLRVLDSTSLHFFWLRKKIQVLFSAHPRLTQTSCTVFSPSQYQYEPSSWVFNSREKHSWRDGSMMIPWIPWIHPDGWCQHRNPCWGIIIAINPWPIDPIGSMVLLYMVT